MIKCQMRDILLFGTIAVLAVPVLLVTTMAIGFGVAALIDQHPDEECQR